MEVRGKYYTKDRSAWRVNNAKKLYKTETEMKTVFGCIYVINICNQRFSLTSQ